MNNSLFKLFCFAFVLLLILSCNKEEVLNTKEPEVELRQIICTGVIEDDPVYVTGYYTYDDYYFTYDPNIKYTFNYNALTVKNRFDVYDGNGVLVASTNAYVTGTGSISFIVCPSSPQPYKLVVKAYSPTPNSLDRWKINLSCRWSIC